MNKNYYIDTEEKFNWFIAKTLEHKIIAVDTEFLWRNTYNPILGLIQVAFSKDECYLIDTIAIEDISAFGKILANKNIVKILHDAQQDLLIMSRLCNYVTPMNIFDTRRAAGFAGLDHTISLAKLINELLGILLPKSETTTDWTRRPLTENQIQYAIDDVIHMCDIREILLKRINQNGFGPWLNNEMKFYENNNIYKKNDPDERYLKLKGISRLNHYKLKIVKHIAAWREKEAIKRDIPKTFIIKDNILLKIVHANPKKIQDLIDTKLLPPERIRNYGGDIIGAIKTAENSNEDLRNVMKDLKIVINGNELVKLKQFVIEKANELNLAVDIIATRADLVKFLEDKKKNNLKNNQLLKTWRKDIFKNYII